MQPSWLWIGIFALGGVSMGLITSLVGLRKGHEIYGWVLVYGLMIAGISVFDVHMPFWTLLMGSILSGLVTGMIQAALLARYRHNNPWYRPPPHQSPTRTRLTFVVFGLLMGIMVGLLAGGIAFMISLLR